MPGQAIVVVDGKQWAVNIASTYAELTTGLSGIASMGAGTGVLFDMGVDQASISVNMAQMLFPLDIVFINSAYGVVGVLHDVQPSESAEFQAVGALGARYFLELNANEAEGVSVGDSVSISGQVQPAFWAAILVAVRAISVIAVTGAVTYSVVKAELGKGKEAWRRSGDEPAT